LTPWVKEGRLRKLKTAIERELIYNYNELVLNLKAYYLIVVCRKVLENNNISMPFAVMVYKVT